MNIIPIFALILNFIYIRRKKYFYVDHIIFTIHLFCASFIFILVISLFSKLNELTGSGLFKILNDLIILVIFFYEYKALRNFYEQRRGKTIVKFFLINFLAYIAMTLLVIGLLIISALQI